MGASFMREMAEYRELVRRKDPATMIKRSIARLEVLAMGAGNPDWLKDHTDDELLAIAHEMESRAEQFDSNARQILNDELRRRKLPTIGFGTSRF